MNNRQAKREACFRAAQVVRDAMGHGWPREQYSESDYATVSVALNNLITELERRGGVPAEHAGGDIRG